jgi:hypothetical protein
MGPSRRLQRLIDLVPAPVFEQDLRLVERDSKPPAELDYERVELVLGGLAFHLVEDCPEELELARVDGDDVVEAAGRSTAGKRWNDRGCRRPASREGVIRWRAGLQASRHL